MEQSNYKRSKVFIGDFWSRKWELATHLAVENKDFGIFKKPQLVKLEQYEKIFLILLGWKSWWRWQEETNMVWLMQVIASALNGAKTEQ